MKELTGRIDTASKAYGMEISEEKTKVMNSDTDSPSTIKANRMELEVVSDFKYL